MNPTTKSFTADDIAYLTGCGRDEARTVMSHFPSGDLRYRELDAYENAQVVAEIERALCEGKMRVSGENDPSVWIKGWEEVAKRAKSQPITVESLRPQYFRGDPTCRLFGRHIRPLAREFEYDVGLLLRQTIFENFLRDYPRIVEFGCGTGINLLLLSKIFPEARLIGCDWAPPSKDILTEMARQTGRDIQGHVFNMLTAEGWDGEDIGPSTAVLTVHAMEQLGPNWTKFFDYLAERRPGLCLHIEPLVELYSDTPFDDLARRYHRKRGYLDGFHRHIQSLAGRGEVEVLSSRRVAFGGLYHEAYSVMAWRFRS